jgi:hypothetical protein
MYQATQASQNGTKDSQRWWCHITFLFALFFSGVFVQAQSLPSIVTYDFNRSPGTADSGTYQGIALREITAPSSNPSFWGALSSGTLVRGSYNPTTNLISNVVSLNISGIHPSVAPKNDGGLIMFFERSVVGLGPQIFSLESNVIGANWFNDTRILGLPNNSRSPSVLNQGSNSLVYFSVGTGPVFQVYRVTVRNSDKTIVGSPQLVMNSATNLPLDLIHVDVKQVGGIFWLVGNSADQKRMFFFTSQDGVNFRSTQSNGLLPVLTQFPAITDVSFPHLRPTGLYSFQLFMSHLGNGRTDYWNYNLLTTPRNLKLTARAATTAALSWSTGGSLFSQKVEVAEGTAAPACRWTQSPGNSFTPTNANTSRQLTGLTPDRTYTATVCGIVNNTASPGISITFKTLASGFSTITEITGEAYTIEENIFDSSGALTNKIRSGYPDSHPFASINYTFNGSTLVSQLAEGFRNQNYTSQLIEFNFEGNGNNRITLEGFTNTGYTKQVQEQTSNNVILSDTFTWTGRPFTTQRTVYENGRTPVSSTFTGYSGTGYDAITYIYDEVTGHIQQAIIDWNSPTHNFRKQVINYDANGSPTEAIYSDFKVDMGYTSFSYEYNSSGAIVAGTIIWKPTAANFTNERVFYSNNKRTKAIFTGPTGDQRITSMTYNYDSNQVFTTVLIEWKQQPFKTQFDTYDPVTRRLTSSVYDGSDRAIYGYTRATFTYGPTGAVLNVTYN